MGTIVVGLLATLPPPPPVRYIKLGRGGQWVERSLSRGEIHFGHSTVPEELTRQADRNALIRFFLDRGRSPGKAADFAREIMDFYTLGSDAIWITFAKGRLWWARSEPEVVWIGETDQQGTRIRRTIEPWRDTDVRGRPLYQNAMSTKLTKVAAYQQTLCAVREPDYLLRKLAGDEEPIVQTAAHARLAVLASAADLIAALHWVDFETLVDLLLSRNGWHRVSALGDTQKDADLVVEQAVTGETALVQVKSAAAQATLDDYIERFDGNPEWSRLIFICHTPRGMLSVDRPDVLLWTRSDLAEMVLRTGLFDWLVARVA